MSQVKLMKIKNVKTKNKLFFLNMNLKKKKRSVISMGYIKEKVFLKVHSKIKGKKKQILHLIFQ